MTALEITLIVIGIILLLGSFMVKDRLSQKDIDKIADMSEEELRIVVEKELRNSRDKIAEAIDEISVEKENDTKRELERESNEKIMAINEYSDTVLESINKAHNEIMFLYSMLNDKHDELVTLTGNIEKLSQKVNQPAPTINLTPVVEPASVSTRTVVPEKKASVNTQVKISSATENQQKRNFSDDINHNNEILMLHQQGKNNVEIAKELGIGLGEIKLVIDLYEEGRYGEI